jgi:hypothetical protein
MDGGGQVNPIEILRAVETVLVIDWPSKEVPELLTRAGLNVVVRGGPRPEGYSIYEINKGEVNDGEVTVRRAGRPPKTADLIYSYRLLSELPGIIATAKELGAKTIWYQAGLNAAGGRDPKGCWVPKGELQIARRLAEAAGLRLTTEPHIAEVARRLRTGWGEV